MGAGSVGCWVGGRLAAAGARVHFIGRARAADVLRAQGLTLSDVEGPTLHVAPDALDALDASELPPDGAAPGLVLLAVKSAGTEAAAAQLACVLPAGTPVLSLQNGVDNAPDGPLRGWPFWCARILCSFKFFDAVRNGDTRRPERTA